MYIHVILIYSFKMKGLEESVRTFSPPYNLNEYANVNNKAFTYFFKYKLCTEEQSIY